MSTATTQTKPTGATSPARKVKAHRGREPMPRRTWLLMAAGFVVFVIGVAPYLLMVFSSLKPGEELYKPNILPKNPQWSNYIDVWSVQPIGTFLKNSLLITVCATAIVLFCAIPAAYYLARHDFRGKGAFLVFVLFTQMVAPTAVLIGVFREFRRLGLVDSLFALILTDAAFNIAFAVWILNSFFASIPRELEEAGMIDGCTRMGVLRRIIMPLSGPGIVTAAVFTFVAVWNEFVLALTLISTDAKKPMSVGITGFVGQYDVQYQYMFAASVIAIVPVVIMFALIEKRLVGGLTAGAVK